MKRIAILTGVVQVAYFTACVSFQAQGVWVMFTAATLWNIMAFLVCLGIIFGDELGKSWNAMMEGRKTLRVKFGEIPALDKETMALQPIFVAINLVYALAST